MGVVASVFGVFLGIWLKAPGGSIADWFVAIGTVGTFTAVLVQAARDRRRVSELERKVAKEHLQNVVVSLGRFEAMTTKSENGTFAGHESVVEIAVNNDSPRPIRGVTLYNMDGGMLDCPGVIRANGDWLNIVETRRLHNRMAVQITFYDPDGMTWLLDSHGNLYDESSAEYEEFRTPKATGSVSPESTRPTLDPSARDSAPRPPADAS